jgi:hypothetical protein
MELKCQTRGVTEKKDNMDTKNDYIEILHYNYMYLTCCEVNTEFRKLFTWHTKERFKPKTTEWKYRKHLVTKYNNPRRQSEGTTPYCVWTFPMMAGQTRRKVDKLSLAFVSHRLWTGSNFDDNWWEFVCSTSHDHVWINHQPRLTDAWDLLFKFKRYLSLKRALRIFVLGNVLLKQYILAEIELWGLDALVITNGWTRY